MILIYNPRTYNGMPSAEINDLWSKKSVRISINELKKFEDDGLGAYLLKKYAFLREVEVDDVVRVQQEIARPEPKDPEEIKERKLKNLTKKQLEILESIPSGDPRGAASVTPIDQRPLTPEESAGIPSTDGARDGDGVTWVGEGLEEDRPDGFMVPRKPGSTRGVFGAA